MYICPLCHGQVRLDRFSGGAEWLCLQCGRGPDRRLPTPAELQQLERELLHHRPGGLVDTR